MDPHENDDYMPDEGHLVSGRPRKSKHIEAGGPGGRPGQRGKNKREHGEKPVVTVKWNQQLTEQLWALIKAKPDLKRVLVNEPTRFLGPHGAGSQLFSKKDLQRTIAEHLFNDGMYDLTDQVIMDNLTRAVKNKLHKTQMLYEASLSELPKDFKLYQQESDIPPELRGKWAKVKDRFPTYFEYHELAQEIPVIAAQMEHDAQQFGAWKAKTLSGSEDGSQGSFINSRQRSRSIETTASYERPVFEPYESPSLPQPGLPDEQEFEVLPPPSDHHRLHLSDIESVGIPNATGLVGLGGISPGLSPSRGPPLNLQESGTGRWSPNVHTHTHSLSPVMPLALSQPMIVNPMRSGTSTDGIPSNWSSMNDSRGFVDGAPPYDGGKSILQGVWTTEPSTMSIGLQQQHGVSRFPAIPMSSVPQAEGHLTAQNSIEAAESRHSSVGILGGHSARKRRRGERGAGAGAGMGHERVHSGDFPPDSAAPSVSPQATSPYSTAWSSTSGSGDTDSQKDERVIEQLLQILRERETRKKRNQDEKLRLKLKFLEDRELQRLEYQRQREENEKQRQHKSQMMAQQLRLAELEAQRQRHQSDSMRSSSAGIASPDMLSHDQQMGGYGHENGPHDLQYPDSMMVFSHGGPQQQQQQQPSFDQQTLAMMGMSSSSHTHTPIGGATMSLAGQPTPQQQQQQQQQRMGMMHMGQNFGQDGFRDTGIDELLAGTLH